MQTGHAMPPPDVGGEGEVVASITVNDLTADRIVYADSAKKLASVGNLASWVAGTSNQLVVADDGDGTITLSLPQDIHTGAMPQFAGVTLTGSVAAGRISLTDAAPAFPAGEYLMKITPNQTVAPGNLNFNMIACTFGNGFGARNNVHLKFGYNISKASAGSEDTSDPATCLAFESYYRPVGDIFTEGYFQCWPIGGGAELTRPFMYNFRHSDNFITTYLGGDDFQWLRGSTGAIVARLVAANYAWVFYDSAVNQRVILDAANSQVQLTASGSIASPSLRNFHSEGTTPGISMWDTGGGTNAKLWDFYATGGQLQLRAVNDAAGAASNVFVVTRSGVTLSAISFGTHVIFGTDNTHDVGASGATRPRSGYFGTSLSIGTNPASDGALRLAYASPIQTRNSNNNGDLYFGYFSTVNSVANVLKMGENSNGVQFVARSGGAAPGTSDLAAGQWCLWRDTGGGTTKLYYNNAGAIESVTLT